jgi:membrane protein implicated in regulation of membrane protease activity
MGPMFFFYLTLAAMLFLIVSMLLGEADNAVHGHDLGHGGGHGHAVGDGHGLGQHAAPDNMSIWSFQMLFLFIGGFGVGGYFASIYNMSALATILCGSLGGVALASIGYFIINIFYRRQANSSIKSEDYIGLTGIVITSISGGGVGQVRCDIGTTRDIFLARSADGSTIVINSVVRIADMIGSTAIVEITDADQQTALPWRS